MISGVLFTIAACLCWSLVFVIPSFMKEFHPLEIALGRFFIYGFISVLFIITKKRILFSRKYLGNWKKGFYLASLSSMVCYTATICNMIYTGPMIATLVFAMSPICISLIGNWHKKEYPFKNLVIPLSLMILGVFLANFKGGDASDFSSITFLIGLFFGIIGLGSWSWFAVANSHFLKQNKNLASGDWALILGTCTFIQVILIGSLFFTFSETRDKYYTFSSEIQNFVLFSVLLGTVSTWVALFFWNHGSRKIPISLSGQLMIFEIIFAIILLSFFENKMPSIAELLGIILMIFGVLTGFKKIKPMPAIETDF